MSNQNKNFELKVENFSITYEPNHIGNSSLRDKFIQLVRKPFGMFFEPKENLLVLDRISFEVKEGDIVGLIGVNGVGKTSLCRYLSGIIKTREIQFTGEARAIFDTNIALYPNLSGYENTLILAELFYDNCDANEKKKIIEEAIEFSELKEFIHMPINQYSRGMKARLYLSLATARPVDLIILDEIFGATDQFFDKKIALRINKLIKESGAAIIVSHNLEDIKLYCNKLIVLSNKKIRFNGSVDQGIVFYQNNQENL